MGQDVHKADRHPLCAVALIHENGIIYFIGITSQKAEKLICLIIPYNIQLVNSFMRFLHFNFEYSMSKAARHTDEVRVMVISVQIR
jgi:hypothetical protein